ncbi:MAG: hypothetical protein FWF27_00740 [Candidatus Bathyarchaeota archaeon]|nr:hypothetical protein [Candidatus Termiticorpusculum sp.]
MAREKVFIVGFLVFLVLVGLVVLVMYGGGVFSRGGGGEDVFYVGITYCGSSVEEAKEFVDRVKNYTNLFVLFSGVLQYDVLAMEEIGDYVVSSGLSYAVCGGTRNDVCSNVWLLGAKERWGDRFVGIYYNDEVGGYMLDKMVFLEVSYQIEGSSVLMPGVVKTDEGAIILYEYVESKEGVPSLLSSVTYWPDGKIVMEKLGETVTYYADGVITVLENKNGNFYTTMSNITKYSKPIQAYDQVLEQNPIQTYDDAAMAYVKMNNALIDEINKAELEQEQVLVFTAEYGLYWWDYKSGYDLVLAELAWNHSDIQEIALVRGAAKLQNKQWGTMITWKYTHPPYLTDGWEMFEQMKMSYEAGAQYVMIFNYSEDPKNPNTLQEEHFVALERFWREVVQNPEVKHGGIKAEVALVLPQNYGWGMRSSQDNIWGIWHADNTTQEIWDQLQNKIEQYGLKLDIVFEDPKHPVAGKYPSIYYWNQR